MLDSDVLNLTKLRTVHDAILRGYDIRIEQARRRHYGTADTIENKKNWQRQFLLLLIDAFDLSEVIDCLTTGGKE